MLRSEFFRRAVLIFIFGAIMLCTAVTHAEIKTYEGYGEHIMAERETADLAKEKAALDAQRDILEQINFYVKSNSKSRNSNLTEDEIITIAAGVLRVIDTKHAIDVIDYGLKFKAFVTATIDIDELETLLDNEIKRRMKG